MATYNTPREPMEPLEMWSQCVSSCRAGSRYVEVCVGLAVNRTVVASDRKSVMMCRSPWCDCCCTCCVLCLARGGGWGEKGARKVKFLIAKREETHFSETVNCPLPNEFSRSAQALKTTQQSVRCSTSGRSCSPVEVTAHSSFSLRRLLVSKACSLSISTRR